MNEITADITSTEPDVAEVAIYFNEATDRFEDSEGNPVESEEVGTVTGEGEVATIH